PQCRSRSSRPTTATGSSTSSIWIRISGRARSSATLSGPRTSKGSTSSSTSSPTTPATSSLTPRTATRRTTRLRARGTTTRAGTASRTPARASTTVNRRQAARLRQLSDYLHANDRLFMFELLVPPKPAQLQRLGNDKKAYDLQLRPTLMVQAIHELQDSGVEA